MDNGEVDSTSSAFPEKIVAGDVTLTIAPGQVFVTLVAPLPADEMAALRQQHGLQPIAQGDGFDAEMVGEQRLQWSDPTDIGRVVAALHANPKVKTARAVYFRADLAPADIAASFADNVLAHFDPRATQAEIEALIAALDLEKVSAENFVQDGAVYQLRLRDPKQQDIFAICDALGRSPLLRYAGPDWIQLHSPSNTITPNDPLFASQWNLRAIQAPQGWDYTLGSQRVVVAILDTGCDLTHPDLINKFVPQGDRLDVLNGTNAPQDLYGHGTWCAGIAAAQTNNAIDVAGVAPKCSIMPIRLYDGNGSNGIRSQADVVRALNWARTHGADVANMSWYYNLQHNLIDIAISDAYGANMVLVAASGNCFPSQCTNFAFIDYPASHPSVMAVGGSDQNDQRQNPATSNFSPPWDSKFGPELSVMAPGMLCPTTKLGGGNTSFYGTSASAPHVAGLAALIMSVRPNSWIWFNPLDPFGWPRNDLTNDQVRRIIEETADKVGGVVYSDDPSHPHGSWNGQMGYGRINLAHALRRALEYLLNIVIRDYSLVVRILLGLTGGGSGVVLPAGGPPVPVDPGWLFLAPEKRDVLLSLAVTELAHGFSDRDAGRALARASWDVVAQIAQRMAKNG
ncbi:MAG: S8 family serine peptidase [Methylocella sp.]|jgi:subtilisin family serine protease